MVTGHRTGGPQQDKRFATSPRVCTPCSVAKPLWCCQTPALDGAAVHQDILWITRFSEILLWMTGPPGQPRDNSGDMWNELQTDGVLLTRDLVASGLSRAEVSRLVDTGELVALRRGALALSGSVGDERRQHQLRAIAAALLAEVPCAVAGVSALVVHDLPLWQAPLKTTQLMRRLGGQNELREGQRRMAAIPGVPMVTVGSVTTVSIADALVQNGLVLPRDVDVAQILIPADAALFRGLVTKDELTQALARHRRLAGVGRVRAVLAHAEGRHESPGETRMGASLRLLGVRSTPQVEHRVNGRRYRVDRQLDDEPVICEFDGRDKYEGQGMGVVWGEKQREDDLRGAGHEFVRVDWAHSGNRPWIDREISKAIARAHGRRAA